MGGWLSLLPLPCFAEDPLEVEPIEQEVEPIEQTGANRQLKAEIRGEGRLGG